MWDSVLNEHFESFVVIWLEKLWHLRTLDLRCCTVDDRHKENAIVTFLIDVKTEFLDGRGK